MAADPNAGRVSVGGQLLSSYPANQAPAQAVGGGPAHIDTGTNFNTDPVTGKQVSTGSATTSATTPQNPQNASPTASPALPNAYGPDAAYRQAQGNLAPSAPPSEEDFFSKVHAQLAPVLDSINSTELAAENAAYAAGSHEQTDLNASLGSRGLAGSSEAATAGFRVNQDTAGMLAQAKQAQSQALQSITQFAIPEAYNEFKDAQTRNDTNSQAYIAQQQKQLSDALAGLSSTGTSLSDLQTSNPAEYNTLLQYANGDPNVLAQMYIKAAGANLLNNGQPVATPGNSLVYAVSGVDANGKPTIKTITTTLPDGVPIGYKMVTNATTALGGVMTQYAPVGLDGTSISDPSQVRTYLNGQQIAGPGTPDGQNIASVTGMDQAVQAYATGIKNGTITSIAQVPAQYKSQVAELMAANNISSPLADSRFTMAVNRIVSNFIALPGYQLTANGLPYLQRIQAAEKTPGSVSDQDLLDSLTKLNTSGNAISDAQVALVTDGQSYADWANVISNKLKNGGVLSDNQREQISTIASNIYDNYQKGYQPIYDQVTSQLKEAQIPSQYWTIPDLNALYAGQTGTTGDSSYGTTSPADSSDTTSGWGWNP